jgi:peptidoglycan L-alanyl-D-glutamate endopeptidase CwlK
MQFSKNSWQHLNTCHHQLQRLFNEVIKHYNCTIIEGHRTLEEQQKLYKQGKSQVKHSKHNITPSLAVDVAPYPIDWKDIKQFYHFVGFVQATAKQLNISIRSGADWNSNNDLNDQTFQDLVHFELIN